MGGARVLLLARAFLTPHPPRPDSITPILIQDAGPALNGVALGFAFIAMVISAVSKCRLRATAISHPSAGPTIEVMLGAPIQACCCC